jgi:hypothetical protein
MQNIFAVTRNFGATLRLLLPTGLKDKSCHQSDIYASKQRGMSLDGNRGSQSGRRHCPRYDVQLERIKHCRRGHLLPP